MSRIYAVSDIHGCLPEFEQALSLFIDRLDEPDAELVLLGDYIHGGPDSKGVIRKIRDLQEEFGYYKVTVLMGNHEAFVLRGDSSVEHMILSYADMLEDDGEEDEYVSWLCDLPQYYLRGNTLFVHAGIDEDSGDMWEWSTDDDTYTDRYPAETGEIEGLDLKVVAGHVGTAEISGDRNFHDIYYDGASHYYIDGSVLDSGTIPVLMVETGKDGDRYYQITEGGCWEILPYDGES